ncbi:uncharacterized protein SAPINGB_P002526 [Magnusiomyces paraingens]|uniref:Glycosyltransferase family 15 protein n=1 Tax=Magnusiomyces paraingens TaxID=2606893 RepID=A0A5E8BGG7_9ASCO|nr:uncharacterized protein SAPINGB_P002526 [Saprochaete ingens]VVT49951.1 unnamed protein product [Saprochaete ingens]
MKYFPATLISRGFLRIIRILVIIIAIYGLLYHFSINLSLPTQPISYFPELVSLERLLGSNQTIDNKFADNVYERANATFVTLARNEDLFDLLAAVQSVEYSFNSKYKYDWIFFNDKEFSPIFKRYFSKLVSGKAEFHILDEQYWGYPDWVDLEKAKKSREDLVAKKIIYGGSESYRHMCRFESGLFYRHPALNNYKYYWRVEPGVKYTCLADKDYFKYMEENDLTYGFTISLIEHRKTIPSLWNTTLNFLHQNPQFIHENNFIDFITDEHMTEYNLCHFWSNFEIADLDFYRSEAYSKYFDYLDASGGFFYERWGDAPVHSIAASIFLNKTKIHHFDDIGYEHPPFQSCPSSEQTRLNNKCVCNPKKSFTWSPRSCVGRYYRLQGKLRPKNEITPNIDEPISDGSNKLEEIKEKIKTNLEDKKSNKKKGGS